MSYIAPSDTAIGHIHLKVSDLERSVAFYRDIIGLEVQTRMGDRAAFLGFGGYHHHLGLNTWHSAGQDPAPRRAPGLFHSAFLFKTREGLARAYKQALSAGVEIYGWADHGVSQAIYFDDPDGNGIEIYWDRPREDWPRDGNGNLTMVNERFDLSELLGLIE